MAIDPERHIAGENGHTDGICDRCTERFEQRVKDDPEFMLRVKKSMEPDESGSDTPLED